MQFNLTVNEAECEAPCAPPACGAFSLRVHYTEADAGHVSGTFSTREKAEQALVAVLSRAGVIKATIEPAS